MYTEQLNMQPSSQDHVKLTSSRRASTGSKPEYIPPEELDPKLAEAMKAVGTLEGAATGTGFIIRTRVHRKMRTFLITAKHVVKDRDIRNCSFITLDRRIISLEKAKKIPTDRLSIRERASYYEDLFIAELPEHERFLGDTLPALRLAKRPLGLRSIEGYAIGYKEPQVARVNAVENPILGYNILSTRQTPRHGDSGSPILNRNLEVVGVWTTLFEEGGGGVRFIIYLD